MFFQDIKWRRPNLYIYKRDSIKYIYKRDSYYAIRLNVVCRYMKFFLYLAILSVIQLEFQDFKKT